jgi:FKBP-type peptidyl-prolyl cis-trans isomerase SlyD
MQQVPYEVFGDPEGVRVGRLISGDGPTGRFHATIAEVRPDGVVLDLNHPLAGKTLHFEVQILAIRRNLC